MYDRVYNQAEGFDMKLHRDDRTHWKGRGLDIYNEVFIKMYLRFIMLTLVKCSMSKNNQHLNCIVEE